MKHLHDRVLDRWSTGETREKIAEAENCSVSMVKNILQRARKRGDERAAYRRVPTAHESRPLSAKPAKVRAEYVAMDQAFKRAMLRAIRNKQENPLIGTVKSNITEVPRRFQTSANYSYCGSPAAACVG